MINRIDVEDDIKKGNRYLRTSIFLLFFACILFGVSLYTWNRNEKIRGGDYYGIKLGMNREEVKERLNIRKNKHSIMSIYKYDYYSYTYKNLFENENYYADELYEFEDDKLTSISLKFMNEGFTKDSQMLMEAKTRFQELYDGYDKEEGNYNTTWTKDNIKIDMSYNNMDQQVITIDIMKED